MAKVTAPLLSLGALGTVGKTQTYSKWKGRPYVRQRVVPANPQTTEQTKTRSVFKVASDMWKGAPALLTAPWHRFAVGQVLTGRNAFIGKYTEVLRGLANRQLMVFSPGAKGGLAPLSMIVTPGVGELTVAVTVPATPLGWSLDSVICAAVEDADPAVSTLLTVYAAADISAPYEVTIPDLNAALHVVGAWTLYVKPDGSLSYGPSINSTGTPT